MMGTFQEFLKKNFFITNHDQIAIARMAWRAGYDCGCSESYDAGWDDGYAQGYDEGSDGDHP